MTGRTGTRAGQHVLATGLDGTLIPIDGNERHRSDLRTLFRQLADNDVTLVFVTGRHLSSVSKAIDEFQLPLPDWIICDVGTSIFERQGSVGFVPVEAYHEHQDQIVATMPIVALREQLKTIEGLRLQEHVKQGRFKLSFYADAAQLDKLVDRIELELDRTSAPYSIIHSIDPFNGDGLIDLLPATVSKAHALEWWAERAQLSPDAIVVAGDSGNDLAALRAGHRAIVVANADHTVAQRAYAEHRGSGWNNRLYLARGKATSGVLEGCRWFGFFPSSNAPINHLGATPVTYNQTHFRVWAPKRQSVTVEVLDGDMQQRHSLTRDKQGYFAGTVPNASPRGLYRYVLDDQHARPDPASRYQPDGVHGPSEIIHPQAFPWSDDCWKGIAKRDLIIYELHIGAFTQQGTFRAAIERIPELVELGVTAVEVMPVAQSPGRWNWGYDGVDLFAVRNTYGEPDDFKAFVDACHSAGLAVILDVVYNHVGPEGNYLAEFGPYFSGRHRTPWGEAFNYDGRDCGEVRKFVTDNAVFWLGEYHLDGLRLDAVHLMLDDSGVTILDEIREKVSRYAETVDRAVHLIAEANVYDSQLLASDGSRQAYDAIWCDCLMHSIYSHAVPDLQLTHREYCGASDLAEVLEHGYLYIHAQREHVRVSAHVRNELENGTARIDSLVTALQTHDSVGNHPRGKRIHQVASKSYQKAAAALTLLYPSIPLIFMGEESASESPFPFFVDFEDERLSKAVDKGRAREYPQHVWRNVLAPSDPAAFFTAKCDAQDKCDTDVFAWYRQLIAIRMEGITEGWLTMQRMTSAHNQQQDVFSLRFDGGAGCNVFVHARLTKAGRQNIEMPLEGTLLCSSEPNPMTSQGHVSLRANHVVISRT